MQKSRTNQQYDKVADLLQKNDDSRRRAVVLGVGPDQTDHVHHWLEMASHVFKVCLLDLLEVWTQRLEMKVDVLCLRQCYASHNGRVFLNTKLCKDSKLQNMQKKSKPNPQYSTPKYLRNWNDFKEVNNQPLLCLHNLCPVEVIIMFSLFPVVPLSHTIDNRILKFLDLVLRVILIDKNVTNFTERKNGEHFERRAAIGWRNMPHYSYIAIHMQK